MGYLSGIIQSALGQAFPTDMCLLKCFQAQICCPGMDFLLRDGFPTSSGLALPCTFHVKNADMCLLSPGASHKLDEVCLSILVYTILRIVWTHSRPLKHVSELNCAPD